MAKSAERRPIGRPKGTGDYTAEVAQTICERLSVGDPLAEICRTKGMPAVRTVSDWKREHADFAADFARAREDGFDAIAQRARKTLRGKVEAEGGESTGDVQRDKAIADFDLKLLAKWHPKRYGDKVALVGGGDDDAPIRTVRRIERVIVDPANRDA